MTELTRRRRVAVESPYKAPTPEGIAQNVRFAQNVSRDVGRRGGSAFAMHLFYTQFLDDRNPIERTEGIESGLAWTDAADEVWYCIPEGATMSSGMELAVARNTALVAQGDPRRIRHLRYSPDGTVCLTPDALADFVPTVDVPATPQAETRRAR